MTNTLIAFNNSLNSYTSTPQLLELMKFDRVDNYVLISYNGIFTSEKKNKSSSITKYDSNTLDVIIFNHMYHTIDKSEYTTTHHTS